MLYPDLRGITVYFEVGYVAGDRVIPVQHAIFNQETNHLCSKGFGNRCQAKGGLLVNGVFPCCGCVSHGCNVQDLIAADNGKGGTWIIAVRYQLTEKSLVIRCHFKQRICSRYWRTDKLKTNEKTEAN